MKSCVCVHCMSQLYIVESNKKNEEEEENTSGNLKQILLTLP